LSGVRWTTGLGIALGGVGGAVAALVGAPARSSAPPVVDASVASARGTAASGETAPSRDPVPSLVTASAERSAPAPSSASPPGRTVPAAAAPPSAAVTIAPLELPTSAEALLEAEVLCVRKKRYDECSRAAEALEKGSAGAADAAQAKRFRKIALTYLVAECEVGDPHACFIMAAKYRAGAELKASPVRAAALEKRALDLCRLRSAPECPAR
jgi:hypothetical protein